MQYKLKCSFFEVLQLRQSIPSQWRRYLYDHTKKIFSNNAIFIAGDMYDVAKLTTKLIYNTYIKQVLQKPACIEKWDKIYPFFHNTQTYHEQHTLLLMKT